MERTGGASGGAWGNVRGFYTLTHTLRVRRFHRRRIHVSLFHLLSQVEPAMPTLFHDYVEAFDAAFHLEERTGVQHFVREVTSTTFVIVRTANQGV